MKKYIVRDGDTMWSISKATGVKLNMLMAANPQVQDPNQLQPGNLIVIPELNKKPPVAQAGIGTSIPMSGTASPQAGTQSTGTSPQFFGFVWPHVVKTGETWQSIAQKYNVSVGHLEQLNPQQEGTPLQGGEVVYIPGLADGTYDQGATAPTMGKAAPPPHSIPNGTSFAQPNGIQQPGTPSPMQPGMVPDQPDYPMQPGMAPGQPGYPMQPGMGPGEQGFVMGPHTHMPTRTGRGAGYAPGAKYVKPTAAGYWAFIPYHPHMFGLPAVPAMKQLSPYRPVPATWYSDWDESSSIQESSSTWPGYRTWNSGGVNEEISPKSTGSETTDDHPSSKRNDD